MGAAPAATPTTRRWSKPRPGRPSRTPRSEVAPPALGQLLPRDAGAEGALHCRAQLRGPPAPDDGAPAARRLQRVPQRRRGQRRSGAHLAALRRAPRRRDLRRAGTPIIGISTAREAAWTRLVTGS